MKKNSIILPEIKIVALKVRTSNELEANPNTALIGKIISNYFQNELASKIPNRKSPNVNFSIYTNYESDYKGAYDYYFGEEVTAFDDIPDIFSKLVIAPQNYTKFTVGPGIMPNICIESWQKIWQMNDQEIGGPRNYHADFERYDNHALDPHNSIFDIYIGIKT